MPAKLDISPSDQTTLFRLLERDPHSRARSGLLSTAHGEIPTPAFMPVGTAGAIKALPQECLERLGVRLLLSNTYHLYLRPGEEVIASQGGLHRFISWPRAILTDSGGYQVFSQRSLRSLSEEGVEFRSHLDGKSHFLTPERAVQIQRTLGSDIAMVLDECTPYPVSRSEARLSMLRSMRWAARSLTQPRAPHQHLFGIVQGSVFPELRRESLERLLEIGFAGYALGGFSVGEPRPLMYDLVAQIEAKMPEGKPRYVMGVGTPLDILTCVRSGMDLFDCVLPTRNARNGSLFTSRGVLRIKNSRYRDDPAPLDPDCRCLVCRRYSRSYLRHLFVSGEIVASVLNTYHNLHFYLDLMVRIREGIASGSLGSLESRLREVYTATTG